jgi:hypothetical protein
VTSRRRRETGRAFLSIRPIFDTKPGGKGSGALGDMAEGLFRTSNAASGAM